MSVRTIISKEDSLVTAEIDTSYTMRQLILSLEWIKAPNCMQELGNSMKGYFNHFVPKKTGALRNSAEVTGEYKQSVITWGHGIPYARYQYGGIVYEQNIPSFKKGGVWNGWVSVKGRKKVPTSGDNLRLLGHPAHTGWITMRNGPYKGRQFKVLGYTKTPDKFEPTSNWIEMGKKDPAYAKWRAAVVRKMKEIYETRRIKYYAED